MSGNRTTDDISPDKFASYMEQRRALEAAATKIPIETDDAWTRHELAQQAGEWRQVAEKLAEAMSAVRSLISEAAQTGFNYRDGDWPERLFASQWNTSQALASYEAMKTEAGK